MLLLSVIEEPGTAFPVLEGTRKGAEPGGSPDGVAD